MLDFLRSPPNVEDPRLPSVFDETSFWCARFGTLLLDNLELGRGLEVLDVGCGTGFPSIELAQMLGRSSRVTGVDTWREALARARLKIGFHGVQQARVVCADGAILPFRVASFDLVVGNLVLNNLADPSAVHEESSRVSRNDARLAMTTNVRGHMREVYDAYRETLVELGLAHRLEALERQEAHRRTADEIVALLSNAGFRVTRTVEDVLELRFLDADALFNHSLTRLGFLPGWRSVVDPREEHQVFAGIVRRLDETARKMGELKLTVPMLFVEAQRGARPIWVIGPDDPEPGSPRRRGSRRA